MAYTVLARRYRSRTFDDVVGQEHVAQTLKKAITAGRVAHAYLFCGTRGVGKTSMARILAAQLNCPATDGPTPEPCPDSPMIDAIFKGDDLDVVEIDAASNTGVDNVRDLIENSRYRPVHGRFKIYIIDEVHMLSKAAFNALLKVMEEPPSHVKFILATTEPEKVLPTILSRCQRFDFRNIPTKEIAAHLKHVASEEGIDADADALLAVSKAGAGSMRDALSLLDRLLSVGDKHLTAETVEQLLGVPRGQVMFDLSETIGAGDVKGTLEGADAIIMGGISPDILVGSLSDHLRNLLILNACGPESELVEVPGMSLDALAEQAGKFDQAALAQDIAVLEELRRSLRTSQAGRALLDATLVRLALAEQFSSIGELVASMNGGAAARPAQKKTAELSRPTPRREEPPRLAAPLAGRVEGRDATDDAGPNTDATERAPQAGRLNVDASEPAAVWSAVLAKLATVAPRAEPFAAHGTLQEIADGVAVVRYAHAHAASAEMLDRNGKREQLAGVLSDVLGAPTGVRFEVDPAPPPPADQSAADQPTAPSRPALSGIGRGSSIPPAARPDGAPGPRPTDIPNEQFEQDPLVAALIKELDAKIVKVEKEE